MPNPLVQSITLLGFGFILGLKHALDADHVVAVSTIVSQTKSLRKSSVFGLLWGVGHTTTLFLVGFFILTLKLVIPVKLALSFEFLVGIVLVIMGADILIKIRREKLHLHKHEHNNKAHVHLHKHKETNEHHHHHKSFIVGMIHGLAGSAALVLLVLSTVKSTSQGLLFILIFGVGSIAGMFVTSAIVGLPFVLTSKFDRINEGVKIAAGTISIILGLTIIYEIGVVRRLFF